MWSARGCKKKNVNSPRFACTLKPPAVHFCRRLCISRERDRDRERERERERESERERERERERETWSFIGGVRLGGSKRMVEERDESSVGTVTGGGATMYLAVLAVRA